MKKTWQGFLFSYDKASRRSGLGLVQRLCDTLRAQGSVSLPPYP